MKNGTDVLVIQLESGACRKLKSFHYHMDVWHPDSPVVAGR